MHQSIRFVLLVFALAGGFERLAVASGGDHAAHMVPESPTDVGTPRSITLGAGDSATLSPSGAVHVSRGGAQPMSEPRASEGRIGLTKPSAEHVPPQPSVFP